MTRAPAAVSVAAPDVSLLRSLQGIITVIFAPLCAAVLSAVIISLDMSHTLKQIVCAFGIVVEKNVEATLASAPLGLAAIGWKQAVSINAVGDDDGDGVGVGEGGGDGDGDADDDGDAADDGDADAVTDEPGTFDVPPPPPPPQAMSESATSAATKQTRRFTVSDDSPKDGGPPDH